MTADEINQGGEAGLREVVLVKDGLAGSVPNLAEAVTIRKCVDHPVRQLVDFKKRNQYAIFVVENFAHRRRVRPDDKTARTHGLKQRPRQYKRVGEINMR